MRQNAALERGLRPEITPEQHDIVERFMPLAAKLARDYLGCGVDYEDLVQEANEALCDAALRHDPVKHPEEFAQYAKAWVRKRLVDAVAKAQLVHGSARFKRGRDEPCFRRSHIPIDQYGFMPEDDAEDELLAHVALALDECTDPGRCVLSLTRGLNGPEMTLIAVARRLGMTRAQAQAHHDGACRTIAAMFRAHGWPVST